MSALYLYINFSKLSRYKSETLRILSNLKILFALDVLLLKVMYFKIRFCSTCTGRIKVLYARPQSVMKYCKCEWKRLKQIKRKILISAKCLILHATPQAWKSFSQRLLICGFHESLLSIITPRYQRWARIRTEANFSRIRTGSDCNFFENWRIRTRSRCSWLHRLELLRQAQGKDGNSGH